MTKDEKITVMRELLQDLVDDYFDHRKLGAMPEEYVYPIVNKAEKLLKSTIPDSAEKEAPIDTIEGMFGIFVYELQALTRAANAVHTLHYKGQHIPKDTWDALSRARDSAIDTLNLYRDEKIREGEAKRKEQGE